MPARSFIGSMEEAARHFYATVLRGEVSDANVRGYLRAASQIEDVWGQIDDELARRSAAGEKPWDAYAARRGRIRCSCASCWRRTRRSTPTRPDTCRA